MADTKYEINLNPDREKTTMYENFYVPEYGEWGEDSWRKFNKTLESTDRRIKELYDRLYGTRYINRYRLSPPKIEDLTNTDEIPHWRGMRTYLKFEDTASDYAKDHSIYGIGGGSRFNLEVENTDWWYSGDPNDWEEMEEKLGYEDDVYYQADKWDGTQDPPSNAFSEGPYLALSQNQPYTASVNGLLGYINPTENNDVKGISIDFWMCPTRKIDENTYDEMTVVLAKRNHKKRNIYGTDNESSLLVYFTENGWLGFYTCVRPEGNEATYVPGEDDNLKNVVWSPFQNWNKGQWYHICLTWGENGGMKMFVNNEVDSEYGTESEATRIMKEGLGKKFTIGNFWAADVPGYHGPDILMKNLCVREKELDSGEVSDSYQDGDGSPMKDVSEDSIIASYPMETSSKISVNSTTHQHSDLPSLGHPSTLKTGEIYQPQDDPLLQTNSDDGSALFERSENQYYDCGNPYYSNLATFGTSYGNSLSINTVIKRRNIGTNQTIISKWNETEGDERKQFRLKFNEDNRIEFDIGKQYTTTESVSAVELGNEHPFVEIENSPEENINGNYLGSTESYSASGQATSGELESEKTFIKLYDSPSEIDYLDGEYRHSSDTDASSAYNDDGYLIYRKDLDPIDQLDNEHPFMSVSDFTDSVFTNINGNYLGSTESYSASGQATNEELESEEQFAKIYDAPSGLESLEGEYRATDRNSYGYLKYVNESNSDATIQKIEGQEQDWWVIQEGDTWLAYNTVNREMKNRIPEMWWSDNYDELPKVLRCPIAFSNVYGQIWRHEDEPTTKMRKYEYDGETYFDMIEETSFKAYTSNEFTNAWYDYETEDQLNGEVVYRETNAEIYPENSNIHIQRIVDGGERMWVIQNMDSYEYIAYSRDTDSDSEIPEMWWSDNYDELPKVIGCPISFEDDNGQIWRHEDDPSIKISKTYNDNDTTLWIISQGTEWHYYSVEINSDVWYEIESEDEVEFSSRFHPEDDIIIQESYEYGREAGVEHWETITEEKIEDDNWHMIGVSWQSQINEGKPIIFIDGEPVENYVKNESMKNPLVLLNRENELIEDLPNLNIGRDEKTFNGDAGNYLDAYVDYITLWSVELNEQNFKKIWNHIREGIMSGERYYIEDTDKYYDDENKRWLTKTSAGEWKGKDTYFAEWRRDPESGEWGWTFIPVYNVSSFFWNSGRFRNESFLPVEYYEKHGDYGKKGGYEL